MTFAQGLAHLEDVAPTWDLVEFGVWWAGAVLALLWAHARLKQRSWPTCAQCGERVHPEEMHWCREGA